MGLMRLNFHMVKFQLTELLGGRNIRTDNGCIGRGRNVLFLADHMSCGHSKQTGWYALLL